MILLVLSFMNKAFKAEWHFPSRIFLLVKLLKRNNVHSKLVFSFVRKLRFSVAFTYWSFICVVVWHQTWIDKCIQSSVSLGRDTVEDAIDSSLLYTQPRDTISIMHTVPAHWNTLRILCRILQKSKIESSLVCDFFCIVNERYTNMQGRAIFTVQWPKVNKSNIVSTTFSR